MSVGENGEIVHKTDELARQFHERYEEIAPLYGYKTRADTKVFDPDSPNGRLMRAVCLQVVGPIIAERDEAVKSEISAIESWDEERKRARREGERVLEAREKYFAMRGLSNNATELAEKYKQERDEAREALLNLSALVRRLFALLETVEVSDSEREFHPTYISSCRVMHTMELNELLPKLKEAAK